MSAPDVHAAESNWLLAALPPTAYARVMALSESVPLGMKDTIYSPDAPIAYAYFPRHGCLSMITVMGDGAKVEVGTIGHEGMAGVSLVLGVASIPTACVVQIAGDAARIPTHALEAELRDHGELRSILFLFAQTWVDTISRGGSCNGVHSVEERCARWLLMTHDRVDGDALPLTQEFLAIMLGVRRASVTLAAASLAQAGLINYKHGRIVVLDREGLESASCECYTAIQSAYARLLPIRRRKLPEAASDEDGAGVGTESRSVRKRTLEY
jgi:CRP-like cAMP-binding protein